MWDGAGPDAAGAADCDREKTERRAMAIVNMDWIRTAECRSVMHTDGKATRLSVDRQRARSVSARSVFIMALMAAPFISIGRPVLADVFSVRIGASDDQALATAVGQQTIQGLEDDGYTARSIESVGAAGGQVYEIYVDGFGSEGEARLFCRLRGTALCDVVNPTKTITSAVEKIREGLESGMQEIAMRLPGRQQERAQREGLIPIPMGVPGGQAGRTFEEQAAQQNATRQSSRQWIAGQDQGAVPKGAPVAHVSGQELAAPVGAYARPAGAPVSLYSGKGSSSLENPQTSQASGVTKTGTGQPAYLGPPVSPITGSEIAQPPPTANGAARGTQTNAAYPGLSQDRLESPGVVAAGGQSTRKAVSPLVERSEDTTVMEQVGIPRHIVQIGVYKNIDGAFRAVDVLISKAGVTLGSFSATAPGGGGYIAKVFVNGDVSAAERVCAGVPGAHGQCAPAGKGAIKVGRTTSYRGALEIAIDAARRMGEESRMVMVQRRADGMFRTLIVGASSATEAKEICSGIKGVGMDCLPIDNG